MSSKSTFRIHLFILRSTCPTQLKLPNLITYTIPSEEENLYSS